MEVSMMMIKVRMVTAGRVDTAESNSMLLMRHESPSW